MAEPILILETGAGLPNSNSYASLDEAESILAMRPDEYKAAWVASDDYRKEQLLIWGTFLLDDWFVWPGVPVSQHQALGFPRSGVCNQNGAIIPSTTIPFFLKRATAEMALVLQSSDTTTEPSAGLERIQVGTIELQYTPGSASVPSVVPRSVYSIVYPYGARLRTTGPVGVGSLPLERA